jgi:hypothetical protein
MRIIGMTWPDSELAATTIRPKVHPSSVSGCDSAAGGRRLRTLLPRKMKFNLPRRNMLDLNNG